MAVFFSFQSEGISVFLENESKQPSSLCVNYLESNFFFFFKFIVQTLKTKTTFTSPVGVYAEIPGIWGCIFKGNTHYF